MIFKIKIKRTVLYKKLKHLEDLFFRFQVIVGQCIARALPVAVMYGKTITTSTI
jgi:hypothetical protein